MREISLSRGFVALIDDCDYELVSTRIWHAQKTRNGFRAGSCKYIGNYKSDSVLMHRLIMGVTDPKVKVDHRNHNQLDNRRENLRVCSNQQNGWNALKHDAPTTSQFKGVSWSKERSMWRSYIVVNNKQKHLGRFKSEIEAARAYDQAATALFGEFALLNAA